MEEGYLWAIDEQQGYRDSVYKALKEFSSSRINRYDYGGILKNCLEVMYKIDPFSEDAADLIIRYYGEQNQRSDLECFYGRYLSDLKAEMNMNPTERTRQLYRRYTQQV